MTIGLQVMLEALSGADRASRSQYHLTLGELIRGLSQTRRDATVHVDHGGTVGKPDSYRGYYADLAFAPAGGVATVGSVLDDAAEALGGTFTGYKGGDYIMGDDTPLWIAEWGTTLGARAVVGMVGCGTASVTLVTKVLD